MQLPNILKVIALATASSAITVSYDTGYDNPARSLTSVSCSDGKNGLITRYGWQTQGQVPKFPYISGVQGVSYNSPTCGTCWRLEYEGKRINVLAVDASTTGYNIGLTAMNALTDGQAEQLGRIDAKATQVAQSDCGVKTENNFA